MEGPGSVSVPGSLTSCQFTQALQRCRRLALCYERGLYCIGVLTADCAAVLWLYEKSSLDFVIWQFWHRSSNTFSPLQCLQRKFALNPVIVFPLAILAVNVFNSFFE